jgi:AraC family transcriptional regulator
MGYRKDHSTLGLEMYDHRYTPVTHDPDAPDNMYDIYIPIKR